MYPKGNGPRAHSLFLFLNNSEMIAKIHDSVV